MLVANALMNQAYERPRQMSQKRKAHAPSPRMRTYMITLVCCLVLFALNAFLHGIVTTASLKVEMMTTELMQAEKQAEATEVEIAYLSSYQRIAQEAETRLAMHAPAPSELRFVAVASNVAPVVSRQVTQQHNMTLASGLGNWLRGLGRAAASTE